MKNRINHFNDILNDSRSVYIFTVGPGLITKVLSESKCRAPTLSRMLVDWEQEER